MNRYILQLIKRSYNVLSVNNRGEIYAMLDRPYSKEKIISINQPLILISQIQRSGGSLLNQLFDSHPQLYTLPIELHCVKYDWLKPSDINNLEKFYLRHNRYMHRYVYKGFDKGKSDLSKKILFDFNFGFQEKILNHRDSTSVRESSDRFFTSFFNSWTNYLNWEEDKKFKVAFVPRTIQNIWERDPENSFFSTYPDGYIISIVRHPENWYSSAEKHSSIYSDPDKSLKIYNLCLEAALNIKLNVPDQIIIITFEDLIQKTKSVMNMICSKTGIDYNPSLLKPTFNSFPTTSNSSHNEVFKIDQSVLDRKPKKNIKDLDSYRKAVKLYSEACEVLDPL